MYEVLVTTHFSAAHQLRGYDGKYENLHGHNWTATVIVHASKLDTMEVGVDFVVLKKKTEDILSQIDYKNINEVPPFDTKNPSAENIAKWLFENLSAEINNQFVKVKRVQVNEFDHSGAAYLG